MKLKYVINKVITLVAKYPAGYGSEAGGELTETEHKINRAVNEIVAKQNELNSRDPNRNQIEIKVDMDI